MRSVLVSAEALERRRGAAGSSSELAATLARLRADAGEFAARPLYVPKPRPCCRAGAAPAATTAPSWPSTRRRRTRSAARGADAVVHQQSHRWWVYWYQLWLAERCWHCALLGAVAGEPRLEARAREVLAALAARYLDYPLADNVLGPSRPFFSTYLESIWVLQLAAAASLLGERGALPADLARELEERLFRPAAAAIADFEERGSNRQAWNAAALFALGSLLGDAPLKATRRRGSGRELVATLDGGSSADGLWTGRRTTRRPSVA